MEPISWVGVLLGLGVLLLVVVAALRGEFSDAERPKYEMLGREPPPPPAEGRGKRPGRLGVEDRIVRAGLAIAAGYYAARLGGEAGTSWLLGALALYLGVTALLGRDGLYRLLGWDSRLPEHR